eukprot:SAG25_NODE_1391_length_3142_cov_1.812028_1_plen_172_part_00
MTCSRRRTRHSPHAASGQRRCHGSGIIHQQHALHAHAVTPGRWRGRRGSRATPPVAEGGHRSSCAGASVYTFLRKRRSSPIVAAPRALCGAIAAIEANCLYSVFREFSLSRIPASGQPRNRSAAAGIADLTEIHTASISSSQNTRKKAEARKKAEELNSQQHEHVTPIEPF